MKIAGYSILLMFLVASCFRPEIIFSDEKIYEEVNFYSFVNKNDDSLTDSEIRHLLKQKPLSEYHNKDTTGKFTVLLIYSYLKRFKQNEIEIEPLEVAIVKHPTGEIEIRRGELEFDWNLPPPDADIDTIPLLK